MEGQLWIARSPSGKVFVEGGEAVDTDSMFNDIDDRLGRSENDGDRPYDYFRLRPGTSTTARSPNT